MKTELLEHLRQFRHNSEDGLVAGYDMNGVDKLAERIDDEMRQLRAMLAYTYAGSLLYSDDGEMQDTRTHPIIDFKRDSPTQIWQKMLQRAARSLK